jgi:hypothetical protein
LLGAGFATTSKNKEEDEDEDLDVEEDDDDQFGTVQYSERDIVVNTEDDNEEAYALREMVSGGSVRAAQSPRHGFEETVVMDEKPSSSSHHINTNSSGHSQLVIDSLKSRIHQLVSFPFYYYYFIY